MFFVNCDLCTPMRSATSLLIPSNKIKIIKISVITNLQMDLRFKLYCSHHWARPHYHWVTGTITWEIARKISSDNSYTTALMTFSPTASFGYPCI